MKHSKLPWTTKDATVYCDDGCQVGYLTDTETRDESETIIEKATVLEEANAAFIVQACNSHIDLVAACEAAIKYDNEIRKSANDPEKMASHCTAEGETLDSLYYDWMTKARKAVAMIE